MTIDELIKLIVDNGIDVVCVGYLIYFQLTTMKDLLKNQMEMQKTQIEITNTLNDIKDELKSIKTVKNVNKKGSE